MRRPFLSSLLALLVTASCLTSTVPGPYFPPGTFDGFVTDWYSRAMWRLGEESLLPLVADPAAEVYRFTWLRTFHHPVVIQVAVRTNRTADLVVRIASGAGGYDPGYVFTTGWRRLSESEAAAFLAALEAGAFWSMPLQPVPEKVNRDGVEYEVVTAVADGAAWILEGVKHGRYHVVSRSSPADGEFREAMLMLLGLSGEDFGEIY